MFYILFLIAFIPVKILFPVKIYGKKNIQKKHMIFAINHRSNSDPFLMYSALKTKIRFLAKKEVFRSKTRKLFFKNIMGLIPIDRKNPDLSSVKEVLGVLKENKTVGIFPEGTRKNISEDQDFAIKNGTAMFAIKSKTPITPVYITKKHKFFKKTEIVFGKPFELHEFYDKKLNKEVLDEVGKILGHKMDEVKDNYLKFVAEKALVKKIKKQK